MPISIVLGVLKGLPREVWYIALACAALWFAYHLGAKHENAEWVARMEAAEAKAKAESEKAREVADNEAAARSETFMAEQEALREIIDEAERTGANPLDSIFAD